MNRIFNNGKPVAELENVTKSFGKAKAVDQVDLKVEPGRLTALLGPNGAGKTTSIRLLLGLARPDQGAARLFGEAPNRPERRMNTGVMLQTAGLPSTLRVGELLDLFRSYYPSPLATSEVVEMTALKSTLGQSYGTLSGGQRQRLHFALALCGNPDLLFLDEPTVGLDVESRRLFWGRIRDLVDQGRSIVLTTHYLEEADALADHIVVMQNGRIRSEGSPQEIKDKVASRRVRCVTTVRAEQLATLPSVQRVQYDRATLEIFTNDAEAVVRELLERDDKLSNLEVLGAGIEEAFLALTSEDSSPEQEVA